MKDRISASSQLMPRSSRVGGFYPTASSPGTLSDVPRLALQVEALRHPGNPRCYIEGKSPHFWRGDIQYYGCQQLPKDAALNIGLQIQRVQGLPRFSGVPA